MIVEGALRTSNHQQREAEHFEAYSKSFTQGNQLFVGTTRETYSSDLI